VRLELVEQILQFESERDPGFAVEHLLGRIHHAHSHLGSAEVSPDRRRHRWAGRQEFGQGMRY
jgi:hypothetical protein